jgi:transposase
MAFRELTMIDVREVLRRWQARQSERRIARETSADRKTVGRYIHWAVELDLPRDRALDDDEVHAVADCVQARPQRDASDEWREVAAHKPRIEAWLGGKPPLRLSKIHTLLVREGLTANYWTLRRFAIEELSWRKKEPTVLLDDPPAGQEAQVDFGKVGYLVDPEMGRRRTLWVLIVTLSFSRHQFVWPTFVQTTDAICEGLDAAWSFFAAMPLTIVPDNMKGIVTTPDALAPRLCDAFVDYA